jgi:hypothetical protein
MSLFEERALGEATITTNSRGYKRVRGLSGVLKDEAARINLLGGTPCIYASLLRMGELRVCKGDDGFESSEEYECKKLELEES